jgi:hypothetical protein
LRVAIEVDGWVWHWDAERLGGERRRHNAVALADWTMPRYTRHDLDPAAGTGRCGDPGRVHRTDPGLSHQ